MVRRTRAIACRRGDDTHSQAIPALQEEEEEEEEEEEALIAGLVFAGE